MSLNQRLIRTNDTGGGTSVAKWIVGTNDGRIGYNTNEDLSGTWAISPTIFSNRCECALYNGTAWVVGGDGTYTLAYSSDGVNWTGINLSNENGQTIGWNGTYWLLGTGTTAYYTSDPTGSSGWTQVTNGIDGDVSTGGSNIIWDGTNWVLGGNALWKINGSNPNGTATVLLGGVIWAVVDWGGPTGKYVISTRNEGNQAVQNVYTMDDSNGTNLVSRVATWDLGITAVATANGAYAVDCCSQFRFAYSSDYVNWSVVSQGSGGTRVNAGQYNNVVFGAVSGTVNDSIYIQNNDSIGINLTSASLTNTGLGTGVTFRCIASSNDQNRFV